MKVKELIALLREFDADQEVYLHADHGQTLIQSGFVSTGYVQDLTWMPDEVPCEEVEDDDPAHEVVVIEG